MSNKEFLSHPVNVQLSLSDWLLLIGWVSAHLNESTPNVTLAAIREIGRQVQL